MLKSIKVDSLEWYGYRLLKLIISHAESVGTHTQLKTVAKKAAFTVVPNHLVGPNNETGPWHGGERSFLMLKLPKLLGPWW